MDSRARKNLSNINTELQDVHRIMVQNIEDVLVRGESLSGNTSLVLKKIVYDCPSLLRQLGKVEGGVFMMHFRVLFCVLIEGINLND